MFELMLWTSDLILRLAISEWKTSPQSGAISKML